MIHARHPCEADPKHTGIASEESCRSLMRGSLVRYERQFRQYIDDVRTRSGNREVYKHLVFYAQKWHKEAQQDLGAPDLTGRV